MKRPLPRPHLRATASLVLLASLCLAAAAGAQGPVFSKTKIGNLNGLGNSLGAGEQFGSGTVAIGDLDGDGVTEIAVGARGLGSNAGAVWILFMNANGTVRARRVLDDTALGGRLAADDRFGAALAALGDIDADGVPDIVVGAPGDDDGFFIPNNDFGRLYVLRLNADGSIKAIQELDGFSIGFPRIGVGQQFGAALAALGDLDGVDPTELAIAVGAPGDPDASPPGPVGPSLDGTPVAAMRGAVWLVFLDNVDGTLTVANSKKISDATVPALQLDDLDQFGSALASVPDVDGNGVPELLVGCPLQETGTPRDVGAIFLLRLASDGTATSATRLGPGAGGITGPIDEADYLGASLAVVEGSTAQFRAIVGAPGDDDGWAGAGALWLLEVSVHTGTGAMTVIGEQKISATAGNFGAGLGADDALGSSAAALGDLDGDALPEVLVGAPGDDDGQPSAGAAYVLSLGSRPLVDVQDVTLEEGDAGTASFSFTIQLSHDAEADVIVGFETRDGTATTANGDYQPITGGSVTFTPGQVEQTISVQVNGDTKFETGESFTVVLTSATNAALRDSVGLGTITNDDTEPVVTIADVSQPEDGGPMTFTITVAPLSGQPVDVTVTTADGTALSTTGNQQDYEPVSTIVRFDPKETTKSVVVTVHQDSKDEADETFTVKLTNPVNATLVGSGVATGTIGNDDDPPVVTIADVSEAEDDPGGTMLFTLTLSAPSGLPVDVTVTTADSTALSAAGDQQDYEAMTTTLRFDPKQTQATAAVTVRSDGKFEADELFEVRLSNPVNATIGGSGFAVGTLQNDDDPPLVSIAETTAPEDSGLVFIVTLSKATGLPVDVTFETGDDPGPTAANPAVGPQQDYQPVTTTVHFDAKGDTVQYVPVTTIADDKYELDETFIATLSNPVNATIGQGEATGTIANDDGLPVVSIADTARAEGAGPLVFKVTLSSPSAFPVDVVATTSDQSASSTGTQADYQAVSTTVHFEPKEIEKTVSVTVGDDAVSEPDETFLVRLSSPTDATIGDGEATGTIRNDDGVPVVSFATTQNLQPESSIPLLIWVALSTPSSQTVTVDVIATDGTATSAAGIQQDYRLATTRVTFAPKEIQKEVTVEIVDDAKREADEDFTLSLANPVGATIGDPDSTAGVIQDNDPAPTVVVASDVSQAEDAGAMSFTLRLSPASGQPVSVTVKTSDGSASSTSGSQQDYRSLDTTVTFAAKETEKSVSVWIHADDKREPAETFTLTLSDPVNAGLGGTPTGTGTIENDDDPPVLTVADVSQTENAGAMAFTVSLSAPSSLPISVRFATSDGTASSTSGTGQDYHTVDTTLSFAAKEMQKTVLVAVNGDGEVEPDETFTVTLSSPSGATIGGTGTATGTIRNDDALVTNLCGNPSFEAPLFGWIRYGDEVTLSRVSGDAHTGNWSMKVRSGESSTFGCDDSPDWVRRVENAGDAYACTLWVKSADNTRKIRFRIVEVVNGSTVGTPVYSNEVSLSARWQQLSAVFIAQRAGSSLSLRITESPGSSGKSFQVDDVVIVKVPTYRIVSSAGPGGTIAPLGTRVVLRGGSQTYTFTPQFNHRVDQVLVDGTPIPGPPPSYTFTNVTADHTIAVSFARNPPGTNFVSNPGFESDPIVGWDRYPSSSSISLTRVAGSTVDGAHAGEWVMKVRSTSSSTFGVDDRLPNWVQVVSGVGARYRFTLWVKSLDNTRSISFRVIETYNGSQVGSAVTSNVETLSRGWKVLTADIVAQRAGSSLSIRLTESPGTSYKSFLVDDVEIIEVPPGSAPPEAHQLVPETPAVEFRAVVAPNPARGSAMLRFTTTQAGPIHVRLFDLSGRSVAVLLDERDAEPGPRELAIGRTPGGPLVPGVYFYRIDAGEGTLRGRWVLLD